MFSKKSMIKQFIMKYYRGWFCGYVNKAESKNRDQEIV